MSAKKHLYTLLIYNMQCTRAAKINQPSRNQNIGVF